jgi:hypothetical protein
MILICLPVTASRIRVDVGVTSLNEGDVENFVGSGMQIGHV